MLKKLILLFSVVVLAFTVVACGGDDEEPASSGTETTQTDDSTTETTETTEEDPGTEEDTGSGTDVSDNPQVQQAVESCKQAVQAQSGTLSDDLITELEGVCEEAAENPEAAQEASIEVCKKIAEEMVPEGSARDQVIDQCEAAGQ